MIQAILIGFFSPLQGFKIILSSPKNILFSLVPFAIGFTVVGIGYALASDYLQAYVAQLTAGWSFLQSWGFLKVIADFLLMLVGWILVSLLNFFLAYLCVIIFAGPFYALMVENIFKIELPDKKERSNLKLMFSMFLLGIMKALIFISVGLVCFVLAFLPGLNLITPLILTLTVAFDCTDYAFEVDFLGLRERFRFFREHFWHFLGLSLAILATGTIPGAFFVLLPLFICGATKMYIQLQEQAV